MLEAKAKEKLDKAKNLASMAEQGLERVEGVDGVERVDGVEGVEDGGEGLEGGGEGWGIPDSLQGEMLEEVHNPGSEAASGHQLQGGTELLDLIQGIGCPWFSSKQGFLQDLGRGARRHYDSSEGALGGGTSSE